MRLAGMIWDLDGTLADTLPVCVAAFRHVFDRYGGRRYSDKEIMALFGASEEGMIRRILPEQWREGERAYLVEYERLHDGRVQVFPGIIDALDRLHSRGRRLAIVTGKGRVSADISLRHLGLASYFSHVEVGSPDGPIKPQGIRAVLEAWGTDPEQCAYVGDTPYDMDAAADVGVIGLGAAWAATATVERADRTRAAAIFATVADLMTWVGQRVDSGGDER